MGEYLSLASLSLCHRWLWKAENCPSHGQQGSDSQVFSMPSLFLENSGHCVTAEVAPVPPWPCPVLSPGVTCAAPPAIPHGTHSGGDRDSFSLGDVVTYSCSSGLAPAGNTSLTCASEDGEHGTWRGTVPRCQGTAQGVPRASSACPCTGTRGHSSHSSASLYFFLFWFIFWLIFLCIYIPYLFICIYISILSILYIFIYSYLFLFILNFICFHLFFLFLFNVINYMYMYIFTLLIYWYIFKFYIFYLFNFIYL